MKTKQEQWWYKLMVYEMLDAEHLELECILQR